MARLEQITTLKTLLWKNYLLVKRQALQLGFVIVTIALSFTISLLLNSYREDLGHLDSNYIYTLENLYNPKTAILSLSDSFRTIFETTRCPFIGLSPPSVGEAFIEFLSTKYNYPEIRENFKLFDTQRDAEENAYSKNEANIIFESIYEEIFTQNYNYTLPENYTCGVISFEDDFLTSPNPKAKFRLFNTMPKYGIYEFQTSYTQSHWPTTNGQNMYIGMVEDFTFHQKLQKCVNLEGDLNGKEDDPMYTQCVGFLKKREEDDLFRSYSDNIVGDYSSYFGSHNTALYTVRMPDQGIWDTEYHGIMDLYTNICYIMTSLLLFYFIKFFIYENESKLRDELVTMGCSVFTHYNSWIIIFTAISFVSSLLITLSMYLFILENTSFFIIWTVNFLYLLNLVALSLFLAEFATKSNQSAIIVAILVIGYIIILVARESSSKTVNMLLMFFPGMTYVQTLTYIIRMELFNQPLQGFSGNAEIFRVSFQVGILYFIINFFLYYALTFIAYKTKEFRNHLTKNTVTAKTTNTAFDQNKIIINSLTKCYKRGGKEFKAVDDVSFEIQKNETVALLGQNGAGKSTLIKMLTTQTPPSKGSFSIFGTPAENINEIRQYLGVCNQQNTLWDHLTVYEHLKLFSLLKEPTLKTKEIDQNVKAVVFDLELSDKLNTNIRKLSGGMRRRVSFGKAFVGNPKLVILDEPSAGLDPFTRQSIWYILKRLKSQSTILITTHYTDEAEILGDKFAVIDTGKLAAFGDINELKDQFNCGYELTIEKGNNKNFFEFIKSILKNFPKFRLELETHQKVVIGLPLNEKEMVSEFINNLNVWVEEEKIGLFDISFASLDYIYNRVIEDRSTENEDNKNTSSNIQDKLNSIKLGAYDYKSWFEFFGKPHTGIKRVLIQSKALLYRRFVQNFRSLNYILDEFGKQIIIYFLIVSAIYLAFMVFSEPQSILISSDLLRPVGKSESNLINTVVLDNANVPGFQEQIQNYIGTYWNSVTVLEAPSNTSPDQNTDNSFRCGQGLYDYVTQPFVSYSKTLDRGQFYGGYMSEDCYSLPSQTENYPSRYNNQNIFVIFNGVMLYSSTIISNLFMKYQIAEFGLDYDTQLISHPLYFTRVFRSMFSTTIMFLFAFWSVCFGITTIRHFIYDRRVGIKHLLNMAGLPNYLYFIINGLYDMCLLTILSATTFFISYLVMDSLIRTSDEFWVIFTHILLYIFSLVPFAFLVCLLTKSTIIAVSIYSSIFFVLFIFAFLSSTFEFTGVLTDYNDENHVPIIYTLRRFFNGPINIFSFFCFSESFYFIVYYYTVGRAYDFTFRIFKKNIKWLAFDGCLYWFILIFIHYVPHLITFFNSKIRFRKSIPNNNRNNSEDSVDDYPLTELTRDGIRVTQSNDFMDMNQLNNFINKKIISDKTTNLHISELRKVYKPRRKEKVEALKSISLDIPESSTISLLGANGAGKSTLINIIGSLTNKSSGRVCTKDKDIDKHPNKFKTLVGYCSQEDILWDSLTTLDHLLIFSWIQGYSSPDLKYHLLSQLYAFDMGKYAPARAGDLSGGTKRKLNVLIALLGTRPILLLDEPTTGLDPQSRRQLVKFLNNYIHYAPHNPSIIISTHSFQDAENFSDSILLLNKGQILAYDSLTLLKSQFKNQMEVTVKFHIQSKQKIKELISNLNYTPNVTIDKDEAKLFFEALKKYNSAHFTHTATFEDSLKLFSKDENSKSEFDRYATYWLYQKCAYTFITQMKKYHFDLKVVHFADYSFLFNINYTGSLNIADIFELLNEEFVGNEYNSLISSFSIGRNSLDKIVPLIMSDHLQNNFIEN